MKKAHGHSFGDLPGVLMDPSTRVAFPYAWTGVTAVDAGFRTVTEPFWIAQLLLAGSGRHEAGGKTFDSRGGDLILIPPGTRQAYRQALGTKCHTVLFTAMTDGKAWMPREGMVHLPRVPHLSQAFAPLIRAFQRQPHGQREWQLRALLAYLVTEILTVREHVNRGRGLLSPVQMDRLHSFLHAQGDDLPTAGAMARHLRLSHDHFTRAFTRTFNLSPRAYLLQERMNRAAYLLRHGDLNVSDTARRLGYKSMSSFTRLFRQTTGANPKERV